ncbi:reverse transcriptase domain-containing protein [Tanacetum coccineum]
MLAPWPFYKWGINIAGPFSEGPGKVKFLIVAMDYFTKWIEAKAVSTITVNQATVEGNKNWIEELPHVLWAHRTTIKSSHGDTPFSLTYDTKAVIPAEIRMPTAAIREAKAKLQMTKYYNARVRGVTFRTQETLFTHSNDTSHVVARGKLRPKWEGPYEVTKALGDGAYRLRSMDGTVLPRTWNIANLKKCYL